MTKPPAIGSPADVYNWLAPQILKLDARKDQLLRQLVAAEQDGSNSQVPREVALLGIEATQQKRSALFAFATQLAERIVGERGQQLPDPQAIGQALHDLDRSDLPADLAQAKAAWVDLQAP